MLTNMEIAGNCSITSLDGRRVMETHGILQMSRSPQGSMEEKSKVFVEKGSEAYAKA